MANDEAPSDALGPHLDSELFRALCDPTRLTVLGRLASSPGPLNVTEVSGCCGVHLSGVSRHLKILRDVGIVSAAKRGREVFYELDCGALAEALRGVATALEECRDACGEGPAEQEES